MTIVADLSNPTPNRERIDEAAALRQNFNYGRNKNILEINPHHPMIQELNKIVEVTMFLLRMNRMRTAPSWSRTCTMPA